MKQMVRVQMKEEHIVVEFNCVVQWERLSFGEDEKRNEGARYV